LSDEHEQARGGEVSRHGCVMSVGLVGVVLAVLVLRVASAAETKPGDHPLDCMIEPVAQIEISSHVDGVLDTVTVERGDRVVREQVLATLVSRVERANVELARARAETDDEVEERQLRLEFAERKRRRHDKLHKQNVVSLEEKEQAELDARLAAAQLRQAKTNKMFAGLELRRAEEILEARTVRSPIDGVVVERLLSPGESVEGRPIMELATVDPLRVEVILGVEMLDVVKLGMRAEVTPEAPRNQTRVARVTVVDDVVDSASGTFGVRLVLPNPDYSLPGGLACVIRFLPPGSE